jgi:membrane peptidoglycan carboxypeptidase
VQLEKYQHSPKGRTSSASDKLRQILGASLRVYKSGTDTQEERQDIVVEYLNTMPLAAQAGFGEVHGLGQGLYNWFGLDLQQAIEMLGSESAEQQAYALKHVLALLCSVRAPSYYLLSHRDALESRINYYAGLMQESGILDAAVAKLLPSVELSFLRRAPIAPRAPYSERKHIGSRSPRILRAGPASSGRGHTDRRPPAGRHRQAPDKPARSGICRQTRPALGASDWE